MQAEVFDSLVDETTKKVLEAYRQEFVVFTNQVHQATHNMDARIRIFEERLKAVEAQRPKKRKSKREVHPAVYAGGAALLTALLMGLFYEKSEQRRLYSELKKSGVNGV